MILERMGKGEFSSSSCTPEVKKKKKREGKKTLSFKGGSLELQIMGRGCSLDII